jgi:3-oxoacyl-[acyl-carrier-protein] synthase-3
MDNSKDDGRAPYRARVAAAGRHLPDTRLTTDELMATTRHDTHIDLERLTGIHERRVSVGDEDSYTLAVKAARMSGQGATRRLLLDVVISCSITTPWCASPSGSSPPWRRAARAIGAPNAMTFDVSNACAGMLTGVTILNNWIRQGIVGNGLVVSGEYISQLGLNAARHIRTIMSKELACLTLGDAGAALLLERADAGSGAISLAGFTTIADHSRLCLAYPKGRDPGARMFTDSRAIQRTAISDTPLLLHEVLEAAGIAIHDIDHVITHQTSARAIRKGMAEMSAVFGDSPRHDAVITVDRYGNTASTTHTVALVEELEAGRIRPGETIALLALASGLEIGVVLLTVDEDLVNRYGHNH